MGTEAEKMLAIEIASPGGPDVLVQRQSARPYPHPDEVLIKVEAAGVNRPDILQRKGLYPMPKGASPLPGLEVSGEIVALGNAITDHQIGQKVVALTNGGGYAQYVNVAGGQVLPLPENLTHVEGAALPETLFTVFQVLIERAKLTAGQTILIHGGASGIGGIAIQLATLYGAKAICTVSSDQKAAYAKSLGATNAINYLQQDFELELRDLTANRGADIILDIVGGDYLNRNLRTLAHGGTLIQLALMGGANSEIDLGQLLRKHLTIFGSTLRPQSAAQKAAIAKGLKAHIWPLIETGQLKMPQIRTFELADAPAAHAAMESDAHFGKIVLTVR